MCSAGNHSAGNNKINTATNFDIFTRYQAKAVPAKINWLETPPPLCQHFFRISK
jgi:hypothetical protein